MNALPLPAPPRSSLPTIERAHGWLQRGEHAKAYAEALALLAEEPGNPAGVTLFVNAAACAERHDEAVGVLRAVRHRIAPVSYAAARTSLALLSGDIAEARRHAESVQADPDAGVVYPNLMIAIAEREDDPAAMLRWMREREGRTANVPFAWIPARWEVQGKLGQHEEVIAEALRLEAAITGHPAEQRIVRLHRAMACHNALRFDESVPAALDLIAEIFGAGNRSVAPPPTARLGTRRRQAAVAAEIERLVLLKALPVVVHAGTLLALVRENGFFAFDQDFDLAAVPPATSGSVAEALVATGAFRPRPQPLDTGSFRSLGHVATGLAVDVTEYVPDGDRFLSTWRHPSGVILRQAAVPAFAVRMVDHDGVKRRLPLPDAAEDLLRATYGDWRTPMADFDTLVAAPNILEFTDFLRSIAVIRQADGLLSGRAGQVRHLARHLRDRGVSPDLMTRIADGPA